MDIRASCVGELLSIREWTGGSCGLYGQAAVAMVFLPLVEDFNGSIRPVVDQQGFGPCRGLGDGSCLYI